MEAVVIWPFSLVIWLYSNAEVILKSTETAIWAVINGCRPTS